MSRRLDGLAYGGRSLASQFGQWTRVPVIPTSCPQCKYAVNWRKAHRRWEKDRMRTVPKGEFGLCHCGHLLMIS